MSDPNALASDSGQAYSRLRMLTVCTECGAELLPNTSYCRQCGKPVTQPIPSSEQVTSILDKSSDVSTTKHLEPRPTTPTYSLHSDSLASTSVSRAGLKTGWSKLMIIGIVVSVLLVVSFAVLWLWRSGPRSKGSNQVTRSLIYPGSRTIVDIGDSGGAVLQLETSDPLEKVRLWYEVNLKPTKTLQVTPSSIIQKQDRVTVTLVSEDKHTSIVIKQNR